MSVDDALEGSNALFESLLQRHRRCGRGNLGLMLDDGVDYLDDVLIGSRDFAAPRLAV
jgi:hypothetical protein